MLQFFLPVLQRSQCLFLVSRTTRALSHARVGAPFSTGCDVGIFTLVGCTPQEDRQRIVREVEILQEVDDPHVIHIMDAWQDTDRGEVVFITELMTSGTLKELRARPKLLHTRTRAQTQNAHCCSIFLIPGSLLECPLFL